MRTLTLYSSSEVMGLATPCMAGQGFTAQLRVLVVHSFLDLIGAFWQFSYDKSNYGVDGDEGFGQNH